MTERDLSAEAFATKQYFWWAVLQLSKCLPTRARRWLGWLVSLPRMWRTRNNPVEIFTIDCETGIMRLVLRTKARYARRILHWTIFDDNKAIIIVSPGYYRDGQKVTDAPVPK